MNTVRVSSKGRIVIPKQLRTAFHIGPGNEMAIFSEGDEIHLRRAEQRFARADAATGLGLLARPKRKAPPAAGLKQAVGDLLKRRNAAK